MALKSADELVVGEVCDLGSCGPTNAFPFMVLAVYPAPNSRMQSRVVMLGKTGAIEADWHRSTRQFVWLVT